MATMEDKPKSSLSLQQVPGKGSESVIGFRQDNRKENPKPNFHVLRDGTEYQNTCHTAVPLEPGKRFQFNSGVGSHTEWDQLPNREDSVYLVMKYHQYALT